MTEFDNVREALEHLIAMNESKNNSIIEDGVRRTAKMEDLKEMNKETLYNLADLLGMSDLYC